MKKLLIIAILAISCQKESSVMKSSNSSTITESISFSNTILPKRTSLQPTDKFLIGDTFSGSGTITGVRFKVNNSGGHTERVKVFIDNTLFDTIYYPQELGFGQLLFEFSGNIVLSSGNHFMEIKGNSYGMDSLNVYFNIESISTTSSVSGLPIQKLRRYIRQ